MYSRYRYIYNIWESENIVTFAAVAMLQSILLLLLLLLWQGKAHCGTLSSVNDRKSDSAHGVYAISLCLDMQSNGAGLFLFSI